MPEPHLVLLREPQLEFAHSQLEEHPKDGLFLFGPAGRSQHVETLKVGVIGPGHLLELLDKFGSLVTGHIAPFVHNRAHHAAFPGIEAAFGLRWPKEPSAKIKVSGDDLSEAIRLHNRHEANKKDRQQTQQPPAQR